MRIGILAEPNCGLGEGPLWDAARACLYWVDSLAPALFRYRYAEGDLERWPLPAASIGSLAVCDSGRLILAMERGFYRFDPSDGTVEILAEALAADEGLRFNDGKVDPFGRFVAGAMNLDGSIRQNGKMYRLDGEGRVAPVMDGFFCCNGPSFSVDGTTLYVSGRREGVIEAFDYREHDSPGNAREFALAPNPDGATVDAEDCLWSAQWDAQCLLRFDPDGGLDHRLDIPGQVVTSLMFGGPELDLIFVTTLGTEAWHTRPESPRAGAILVISNSGFYGRPEPTFRD